MGAAAGLQQRQHAAEAAACGGAVFPVPRHDTHTYAPLGQLAAGVHPQELHQAASHLGLGGGVRQHHGHVPGKGERRGDGGAGASASAGGSRSGEAAARPPPPPPPHSLTSRAPCPHNCRPGAASAWPAPRRSRPRLPPTWGQAPASLGDGGSASGCVRGGDAPRQADGGTRVERQRCTLATHPPLPPPRMPASRALQGLAAPHCLTPPIKWGAKSQLNGDQGGGEGEGWLLAAQLDQLRHHAGVGQRRHVAQLVLLLSQQVWQQVCCVGRWRGEL